MREVCLSSSLTDAFRHFHPATIAYTFIGHNSASRLDRIYVTPALLRSLHQCTISPATTSDHRPVILHLRYSSAPTQGRGLPVVRSHFSSHPHLATRFESFLEDSVHRAPPDPHALLAWWPGFKSRLAELACQLNREAKRDTASRPTIVAAKAALDVALHNLETATDPVGLLPPALSARRAYASALGPLARRADRSARHQWIKDGERPSRLLSTLTHPPASVRAVPAVRIPGGGLLTRGPCMASAVSRFWAGVSSAQPRDSVAEQAVLHAVSTHATPLPADLTLLAGSHTISPASVTAMLRRCARGKSPGLDGIPSQLWCHHSSLLAPLLAVVFTAIGTTGTLPAGFLEGAVCPFFKAGDDADPACYRPITLLNTDYRLLAKLLAARLGPVLAASIGPEQTAFLPGRLMGDNVTFLQLLPDTLRLNHSLRPHLPSSAALIFLDFRKAYDTINRDFLYAIMAEVGAGPDLIRWARLLLSSTSACAVVNGHVSEPHPYTAGVRQGCPLAPLLYLFISWALTCWLHACPAVGVEVRPGQVLRGDQYADDTHTLLSSFSPPSIESFIHHMAIFGAASGEHLNLPKCVIVPFGHPVSFPSPLPTSIAGIRCALHARTLGISFGNSVADGTAHMDWDTRISTVSSAFSTIAKLHLSTFGRAAACFGYGTSRILYHAEHSPMPPATANTLDTYVKGLVDRGLPPPAAGSRYPERPRPGIRSHLLPGRPHSGGFGVVPWRQHLLARGALLARRFIAWSSGSRGALLSKRQLQIRARLASNLDITLEDRLLLSVKPCRPLWIDLANDLLLHSCPHIPPSLTLLSASSLTPDEIRGGHFTRLPPTLHPPTLPPFPLGPLTRMLAGLHALGPLSLTSSLSVVPPGPWCSLIPLWGNPIFQLDLPPTRRSVTWPISLAPPPLPDHPPPPSIPPGHTSPDPLWATAFLPSQHPTVSTLGDAVSTLSRLHSADMTDVGTRAFSPLIASLASLLSALPPSWVAAAAAIPTLPTHAGILPLLSSLGWQQPSPLFPPLGPAPPSVSPICLMDPSLSVRSATALQLAPSFSDQRHSRRAYAESALSLGLAPSVLPAPDVLLHHLETQLTSLWRIPWDSHHKETLWRLSVQGLSGGGGHDICPRGPCPCGWLPPQLSAVERASALRSHAFWQCPVAAAVLSQLNLGLPPNVHLSGMHVWLLRAPLPPPTLHGGIWAFVSMVALRAMDLGRRHLWALSSSSAPPPDVVTQASRRASAMFWLLLQDFATLHSPPDSWISVGPNHPFFCFPMRGAPSGDLSRPTPLRLNLPASVALPAFLS